MNIKLLPLDERPCNYEFVKKIANYNNKLNIFIADYDILGSKKKSGNINKINDFIFSDNQNIDYLIISLDMYLYGGLLPSRLHTNSYDEIVLRLNKLRDLKNSGVKIYAFSTIMRTPRYNSSDEEPDYYQKYGEDIFYKKYFEDKSNHYTLSNEEVKKLNNINIPLDFLSDYDKRRATNLKINLEIVNLLKEEIFEYLIFPQDDSAEYGYTRIDQSSVYRSLNQMNKERYSIHPGADEVAMTLISRIYNISRDLKVYTYFVNEEFKNKIPKYEDREVIKTYKLHLEACGIKMVDSIDNADYKVIYNLPKDKMIESFDQDYSIKKDFDTEMFKGDLYILDCCYSNGGDLALLNYLYENNLYSNIKGYSGWNTNANSVGTLLCEVSLDDDINTSLRDKFIKERIIEDCFYQAKIRIDVTKNNLENLGLNYFDLKDKQDEIVEIEKKLIINEFEKFIMDTEFTISHPWNRMFEININVK